MALGPIVRGAIGVGAEIAKDMATEALTDAFTPDALEEENLAKIAQYAMWQSVASSAISAVRWDPSAMEVRFTNGYEYAYPAVPMDVFEDFLSSGSKGRFLNTILKPNYG